MNNGNYEKIMETTTRLHSTPKRILHWEDDCIQTGECKVKDFRTFLRFLDDFDSLGLAESSLSEGRWKLLFAICRGFAESTGINYCIYENPHGMQFDVTCRMIEFKEAQTLHREIYVETDAEKLERLKEERIQVKLKIQNLQTKEKEITARMREIVQSLIGDELLVT
jgi:hypothetical protein